MTNIDRNFLLNALAWLVLGTLFGFWMGASNNLQYVTVHVAMLMSGFVTFAIYGFAYRLWPELKAQGLARAQFWLTVIAQPFMVLGAIINVQSGSILVIAISSAVAIVSAILMAWMFWSGAKAA